MSRSYNNKRCTGDSPCPTCRSMGRDKTGNHLQHWENDQGESWVFCPRCSHYEILTEANRASYESVRKEVREVSDEELAVILADVQECPFQPLTSRGITREVAERFGVRVGLSETDGSTQMTHFYPKTKAGLITGYKVRVLAKKFFYAIGRGRGCDFFGIEQAQAKDVFNHTLYVFEDELSAMSGFQTLRQFTKKDFAHFAPACVSLPDGTASAGRVFAQNREFVESFKEIVVCMDNDEEGNKAARIIQQLHPATKVTKLPMKDANDMVMAGRERELYDALRFKAKVESPDHAVNIADCIEAALKKPEWGLSWPWEGMTRMTYGLRHGEIVAIGAGTSLGKSLLAHELAAHLVTVERQKVGMFMLEETVGNTVKNVCGKLDLVPYHRPDVEFDQDRLRETAMSLNNKIFLWQNFGQNDWENIKQCIRYWVVTEGCKFIVLDNLTCMVSHLTPSEINTEIAKISSELAGMCQELDFTCFVFSHLNAPSGGKSHEEGGEVKEVQFTGSRALMRYAQLIIGFERNKHAEGDQKNISKIRLLKDRNYGNTGWITTKYDVDTGKLSEIKESDLTGAQGGEDDDKPF